MSDRYSKCIRNIPGIGARLTMEMPWKTPRRELIGITLTLSEGMETNLPKILLAKNKMVTSGLLIEAAEQYFATSIRTIDFDGVVTIGKHETMHKMKYFFASIQKINEITLYRTATCNNVTFAEFTFNFEMKDGKNIFWHEIVRSLWKDGQITEEQYFMG